MTPTGAHSPLLPAVPRADAREELQTPPLIAAAKDGERAEWTAATQEFSLETTGLKSQPGP